MNGSRMTRNVAMFAMMLIGLSFAGQAAFAGFKWVVREVRVPYTYYAYETRTRHRTVTRRVVHTTYRTEQRSTIEYARERKLVEEPYFDIWGVRRVRYVWTTVRTPHEVWRTVRIPVETVRYETCREPYTVRVRVARTGYRTERKRVAVRIGSPKFSISLGTNLGGSRDRGRSSHRDGRSRDRGRRSSGTSISFTWRK
jgi:hypothetical protein